MDFKTITDLQLDSNIVFLRGDVDVASTDPMNDPRIKAVVASTRALIDKGAYKIIIAGHKGRPKGTPNPEDSLEFLAPHLTTALSTNVSFVPFDQFEAFSKQELYDSGTQIHLLENLRFSPGEENNDSEFVNLLMGSLATVYVNEAFASSHREHASIVGFPQAVSSNGGQCVAGMRLAEEIVTQSKLLTQTSSPRILILSGVKEDKLTYVSDLKPKFDKILIAGRLPLFIGDKEKDVTSLELSEDPQLIVANLNQDKMDITLGSVEVFENVINTAGTIVVAGPMGKYEDPGQALGTRRILTAVAESEAFKYAGGGDSEDAIRSFGLSEKFDWISVGGGASLEYMAKGTLPGIEALVIDR